MIRKDYIYRCALNISQHTCLASFGAIPSILSLTCSSTRWRMSAYWPMATKRVPRLWVSWVAPAVAASTAPAVSQMPSLRWRLFGMDARGGPHQVPGGFGARHHPLLHQAAQETGAAWCGTTHGISSRFLFWLRWKLEPGLAQKIAVATASTSARCTRWNVIPSTRNSSSPLVTGVERCGWKSWKAPGFPVGRIIQRIDETSRFFLVNIFETKPLVSRKRPGCRPDAADTLLPRFH